MPASMHDRDYLLLALERAQLRRGFCAPNPSVGAVIVKDQRVVATGYHQGPGHPHAEVDAVSTLDAATVRDATLYVTLEPCCHTKKRTPPCAPFIVQQGIARVIYGYRDPNPAVSGQGELYLQNAGVACEYQPLPEINDFYRSYDFWWKTQRPFVTVKIAQSLNGVIASATGGPLAITGPALLRFTHEQRLVSDALLSTVTTILNDDPQLNVRLETSAVSKPVYLLDTHLRLPLDARIWKTAHSLTLFHAPTAPADRRDALIRQGARCLPVEATPQGLHLGDVLAEIGKEGCHDLWVEAGGRCVQTLLAEGLVQRLLVYIAPKFLEGQRFPTVLAHDSVTSTWHMSGDDMVCEIYFRPCDTIAGSKGRKDAF